MAKAFPIERERHGIRYRLLEEPDPVQARFAFSGIYENREVVWDATLMTLSHYDAIQDSRPLPARRVAFMEIGNESRNGRTIQIALDIPHIDEPSILSTIIMIRNYKRLRHGRHEFADVRAMP